MLKTFFSGLEWERHRIQMGLAAGMEGEEEEEGDRKRQREKERHKVAKKKSVSEKSHSRARHKLSHLTDSIVLTNLTPARSSANK